MTLVYSSINTIFGEQVTAHFEALPSQLDSFIAGLVIDDVLDNGVAFYVPNSVFGHGVERLEVLTYWKRASANQNDVRVAVGVCPADDGDGVNDLRHILFHVRPDQEVSASPPPAGAVRGLDAAKFATNIGTTGLTNDNASITHELTTLFTTQMLYATAAGFDGVAVVWATNADNADQVFGGGVRLLFNHHIPASPGLVGMAWIG